MGKRREIEFESEGREGCELSEGGRPTAVADATAPSIGGQPEGDERRREVGEREVGEVSVAGVPK